MKERLAYIIEKIKSENPLHAKRLKKNITNLDNEYFKRANTFLDKYEILLGEKKESIDFAVKCYLEMIADVTYESLRFAQTGKYSSKSFDEVNQRVYANPEIMEYYMHGLLLSQFLWPHHYKILTYFNKQIKSYFGEINNYLEIGAGHGLYISEAISIIGDQHMFSLVDISKTSLEIAKRMIDNNSVSYIHSDVFDYYPKQKFDFITMGEVLEHVEKPVELLKKIYSLLKDDGKLFITTPTNAPAIDHIYLFKNTNDIRKVIFEAGFQVKDELTVCSEDVDEETAERFNFTSMYAGVLKKK